MSVIAVTGPRGRLGSALVGLGCTPIHSNVLDWQALGQEIRKISPDVIIHCAAVTGVDQCEHSPVQAAKVNTGGVFGLVSVFEGKIVYISTDYVFDGRNGPYREEDAPNPISIYGWSKLGGELVIKNRGKADDLIVRTTVLFDRSSKNFVTGVVNKLTAGETVALSESLYGSPTYVPHLATALLAAIDRGLDGTLNLAGDRVLSRFVFGRMIALACGMSVDLVQVGPIIGRAPRPKKAGLIVNKAKALGLQVGDIRQALTEIFGVVETVEAG